MHADSSPIISRGDAKNAKEGETNPSRCIPDGVKHNPESLDFAALYPGLANECEAKTQHCLRTKTRLPTIEPRMDSVEAGGLMSDSADQADSYRRAETYVDKILKGTKTAEFVGKGGSGH